MAKTGIYDDYSNLAKVTAGDLGPSKSLAPEVGVVEANEIYRGMQFFPPNPDDAIAKRGYKVYDEMQKDATVRNSLRQATFAAVSSEWDVVPFSDEDKDVEIAEFMKFVIQDMQGSVIGFLKDTLDAQAKGFSVQEIVKKVIDRGKWKGMWGIAYLAPKDPKDYEFDLDIYGNIGRLLLTTLEHPDAATNPVPLDRFLLYSYDSVYRQPWGRSVLRTVYKHWWSKDFLTKFWNIYLETFGHPVRVGSHTGKSVVDQAKLKNILEDIQANTAITLPPGIKLELLEAAKEGGKSFKLAMDYHDQQIEKGIIGATLTTGTGDPQGGKARSLGEVHERTKDTFISYLRADIEETVVGEQLIRRTVDHNFLDVEGYPRFVINPLQNKLLIDGIADVKALFEIGVLAGRDDVNIVRGRLDLPPKEEEPEEEQEIEEPGETPPGPEIGAEFLDMDGVTGGEFALSRQPNSFEKSVNFQKLDKDMTTTTDDLTVELSDIIESWRDRLIADVDRTVFKAGKVDTVAVFKLRIRGLGDFAKAIKTSFDDVVDEQVPIAYKEVGIPSSQIGEFALVELGAEAMPPAVELAKLKRWQERGDFDKIKNWRGRKISELKAKNNYTAFWITDVEKEFILSKTKTAIFSGIENGKTGPQIMSAINDVFEKYIAREDIENKKLATAPRLETIVRTNTTKLFAQSRRQAFQDPLVAEQFPTNMYSAIMDDRTTAIDISLDGKIYAVNDPIWASITPPLHFNCRGTVVAVNRRDTPETLSVPPDLRKIPEGFGGIS